MIFNSIMNGYVECESYMHKKAKEVLKSWLDDHNQTGDREGGVISFKTDFIDDTGSARCLFATPNRPSGVLLEYPIVVPNDVRDRDGLNTMYSLWDECVGEGGWITPSWQVEHAPDFVPTFEQCVSHNVYPRRVIDIVIPHKGNLAIFIEVCHKNPVSDEKIAELKQLTAEYGTGYIPCVVEIDASWILNQVKKPDVLKIRRWLLDGDYSLPVKP